MSKRNARGQVKQLEVGQTLKEKTFSKDAWLLSWQRLKDNKYHKNVFLIPEGEEGVLNPSEEVFFVMSSQLIDKGL